MDIETLRPAALSPFSALSLKTLLARADDPDLPEAGQILSVQNRDEGADDPDPEDQLAAEFSAFRQPVKNIAIIGSRNIPLPHQNLIEALAYMLVKDGNTLITSGGSSGANAATIRGAMRANPDKLKVMLPQTIGQQPPDVQNQLIGVPNIIEHPDWAMMTLADASWLCNREIVDACQQLILTLFHDSHTLLKTIEYAEEQHKIVTTFFLD